MRPTFPVHLIILYMSAAINIMFVCVLVSTAVNVQIMLVFLLHRVQIQKITPILILCIRAS